MYDTIVFGLDRQTVRAAGTAVAVVLIFTVPVMDPWLEQNGLGTVAVVAYAVATCSSSRL